MTHSSIKSKSSLNRTSTLSINQENQHLKLLEEVERCLPLLRYDKIFSLRDLCSDAFWLKLPHRLKTELGMFFHQCIMDGHDKIEFVRRKGTTCYYKLKT